MPQFFDINAKVKRPMAGQLESVTGLNSSYRNPGEYIRDLIGHDMADHAPYDLETGLLEGYAQLAEGNFRKGNMSEIIARAEREMHAEDHG